MVMKVPPAGEQSWVPGQTLAPQPTTLVMVGTAYVYVVVALWPPTVSTTGRFTPEPAGSEQLAV